MVIWQRKPQNGLMFYSDQGSQYGSTEFRNILKQHDIIQSMSRKGNCWDNEVAESFFKTLKKEAIGQRVFADLDEAKSTIFEYVELFYNRKRQHSYNKYLSPHMAEMKYFDNINSIENNYMQNC